MNFSGIRMARGGFLRRTTLSKPVRGRNRFLDRQGLLCSSLLLFSSRLRWQPEACVSVYSARPCSEQNRPEVVDPKMGLCDVTNSDNEPGLDLLPPKRMR